MVVVHHQITTSLFTAARPVSSFRVPPVDPNKHTRPSQSTQKKRGRCRRLQGILADAKTALSQAEAEERMSLRVAPLLGLSEHLAGAEAGKKA